MINIIEGNNSNSYNSSNINYYTSDFYTYYEDDGNFDLDLAEYSDSDIDIERFPELDMEVEKIKWEVESKLKRGKYLGLWVHHISIIFSTDTDVNNEDHVDILKVDSVKSKKLKLPKYWDSDDPDYKYLRRYVLSQRS